jgi:type IV pilus assembly protein PilQ
MKRNIPWLGIFCWVILVNAFPSRADFDSVVSVNVQNAPIRGIVESIASKAGLHLTMDPSVSGNVTVTQNDMTARQLLEKLATDNLIEYTISGNQLFVEKSKTGKAGDGATGDAHEIILHYAIASELLVKLNSVVGSDGKLFADEHSNKLIFLGSNKVFEKLKSVVNYFDAPQKQIMIEAIIAETSHNFLQTIGVSMGNNGTAVTAQSNNPAPTNPNGTFNAILGSVNAKALNIQLTAAEAKGDAKIVSRPKVVTLNNRLAKVESGVTLNIKTLSNVSNGGATSATSGTQGVVTGSVTSIDAVLSLTILPSLIGNDQIKLVVEINDASPDRSNEVDGIPGIIKNTASTAVILKNKQTAVIAGLIKQSKSKSVTGIPILSDLPILGWLFRTTTAADTNNELVIFLTPTIDDSGTITVASGVDPASLVRSPLDPMVAPAEVPAPQKQP